MSESFELTTNPLLAKINPQPDDQRRYIILIGYVLVDGSSQSEPTSARVYGGLDLRSYLEIQVSEVVWAEKAIPGQESSPTKLVLNADAKVKRVTTRKRVETDFLAGTIASSFLQSAASAACTRLGGDLDLVETHPDCIKLNPGATFHTDVPPPSVCYYSSVQWSCS